MAFGGANETKRLKDVTCVSEIELVGYIMALSGQELKQAQAGFTKQPSRAALSLQERIGISEIQQSLNESERNGQALQKQCLAQLHHQQKAFMQHQQQQIYQWLSSIDMKMCAFFLFAFC